MAFALSLNDPLAPPLPIHRFTVEQYHRLGELGLLTPEHSEPEPYVAILKGEQLDFHDKHPPGMSCRLLTSATEESR